MVGRHAGATVSGYFLANALRGVGVEVGVAFLSSFHQHHRELSVQASGRPQAQLLPRACQYRHTQRNASSFDDLGVKLSGT